jgi:hypothetical protein
LYSILSIHSPTWNQQSWFGSSQACRIQQEYHKDITKKKYHKEDLLGWRNQQPPICISSNTAPTHWEVIYIVLFQILISIVRCIRMSIVLKIHVLRYLKQFTISTKLSFFKCSKITFNPNCDRHIDNIIQNL